MTCVLHHLGLEEPQHLGAEVLTAVRPADPAPRDRAAAKVHPLEPGRMDEDLEARLRLRHLVHARRIELEGEAPAVAAVRSPLVVVGAKRPVDELEEGAEDPVLVEARDRLEGGEDPFRDRVGRVSLRGRPLLEGRRNPGRRLRPRRVEAGVEEAHEVEDEGRVGAQGVLHVGLAQAEADLAEVLRVGAEHRDLPPVEAGREGETVEAVVLRLARPHPGEAPLERLARRVEVRGGRPEPLPEPEVVEPDREPALAPGELAGVLVLDPKAHVLEHREGVREVDRPPEVKELEAEGARVRPGRAEEVHREGAAGRRALSRRGGGGRRAPASLVVPPHEGHGELDVPEGHLRAVAAAVARAEHRHVPAAERGPGLRTEAFSEQPGERLAPPRRRLRGASVPGGGHGRLLVMGRAHRSSRGPPRAAPRATFPLRGKGWRSNDEGGAPGRDRNERNGALSRASADPVGGERRAFSGANSCHFCNTVIFFSQGVACRPKWC